MKLSFSGLFKKRDKYSKVETVADPRLEKAKAAIGYKKRLHQMYAKLKMSIRIFRKATVSLILTPLKNCWAKAQRLKMTDPGTVLPGLFLARIISNT